ncbi:hypothetical protein [Luteimonas sp. R10]|uniref:hypothetical protein n=1 Tax=Luteimonas sp. R10 TaxID=3108176 RepID=UPI003088CAA6|nr:hypothetical protein U3649_09885 [Luteimonas sp. R10]
MTWLLVVHIVGGTLGLLSGTAAMIAAKGSLPHRIAGRVFVTSMLVMAATGGYIAAARDVGVSALAAVLTGYLVGSGWLVGRRAGGGAGVPEWLALAVGIATAAYGLHLGIEARDGRADVIQGGFVVPAAVYFVFSGIAVLGAASDAWALARGGLQGRSRVLQHLWRMCVALYIATSSFFTGQQDLFPAALQGSFLLQVPEILVAGLLLFWLSRVAFSKRYRRPRPVAAHHADGPARSTS